MMPYFLIRLILQTNHFDTIAAMMISYVSHLKCRSLIVSSDTTGVDLDKMQLTLRQVPTVPDS